LTFQQREAPFQAGVDTIEGISNMHLQVTGMTCGHCAAAVKEAVTAAAPGTDVQVDLVTGRVQVRGTDRIEAVAAAIREAGYEMAPAATRASACGCGGGH
jgi:copper chaperone